MVVFFIILISTMYFYWWVAWLILPVLVFVFSPYYEIIFFGVLFDSLYGHKLSFLFTLLGITLFLISIFLKDRLVSYES